MNKYTLYLECYSGISGDMTVAALLDLGADQEVLLEGLRSLSVTGYRIEIGRRQKNSIDACDFNVILDGHDHTAGCEHDHSHDHIHHQNNHHDHDLAHEYNNEHKQDQEYDHDHHPHHAHELKHVHGHQHVHSLDHEHRNLFEINSIIEASSITTYAKELAKKMFYIVAAAEAKAHAKPIEEVHFHEVGAIDSIIDIVATAICIDNLGIKDVALSELYEGTGHINCQHGVLPVPVPAVANIAAAHQLPLHITSVKGELVTPTGAAIAAALRTKETLPNNMKILRIGLGAGKRNYTGASGILRAMLIEDTTVVEHVPRNEFSSVSDSVWVLEANIDDCPGEALAIAMELLFEHGAKDVYYTPIFMKKNRPAYLLGVICGRDQIERMEEIIFTNTTTIGIRRHEALRTKLSRQIQMVSTPFGTAQVKVCSYDGNRYFYPECDSVKKLCKESSLDYLTLYHLIQGIAKEQLYEN